MKKWKNKLLKKLQKIKTYISDQVFYAKKGIKNIHNKLSCLVLPFALSATKVGLICVFSLFTALFANKMHVKYLEYKVGSNVVFIEAMPDSKIKGSGTAFEMKTPSGAVVTVTNAHVCALANQKGEIRIVEKRHSNRAITKRVLEVYEHNDLCVVEGLAGYEGLDVGTEVEVGEPVFSLGYPLGEALHFSEGRVKEYGDVLLPQSEITPDKCVGPKLSLHTLRYFILEYTMCFKAHESIQTSLVIFGGNSGSPMVNMWGNVVGVIFAANTRTNWGSAVVLKDLKELLKAY